MSRASLAGRWLPSRAGLFGLSVMLALVLATGLAGCGGGNSGGGGVAGGKKFHVLIVNHTAADANVTYSGGAPLPSGDQPPIKTCQSGVIDFALTDPFTLTVNDKVVIDSAQIQGGIPNQGQSDVVAQIDVNKDGSLTTQGVLVGSKISEPAALGICL